MDNLIEKVIKHVPKYLEILLSFLTQPKAFLADRLDKDDLDFTESLVFLLLSVIIAVVLQAMYFGVYDNALDTSRFIMVMGIITIPFEAAILYFVLKLFKREPDIKQLFILYTFLSALSVLAYGISSVASHSYFLPEIQQEYLDWQFTFTAISGVIMLFYAIISWIALSKIYELNIVTAILVFVLFSISRYFLVGKVMMSIAYSYLDMPEAFKNY